MGHSYLTPEDLFEVRTKTLNKILPRTDMSDLFGEVYREQEMGEEALRAFTKDDEPSLWDKAKKIGGGVLDVLGRPGQAILELGRGTSLLKGQVGGGSNALKALTGNTEDIEGGPANLRAAMSIDPNAGGRVAGFFDTVGSALVDPTSYVTLGTGAAAKAGLGAVARSAGDDVAQAIRAGGVRAGDDILAQRASSVVNERTIPIRDQLIRAGLDAAPEQVARVSDAVTPRSVRELLESQADTGLTSRPLDDVVDRQLRTLDRRAKGGLGFAGIQTGIGAGLGSGVGRAALPIHRLFSPTAAVGAELGQGAREAVDVAIHTGANVRRTARQELGDQFSEVGVTDEAVKERVSRAMLDDLDQLGGGKLVSHEAKDGWVKLTEDQFVPKVVKDALDQAVRTPPGDALKAFDAAQSILKRYTTLGPFNAIPHVSRNVISNKFFAGLFGGVRDPRYYHESLRLRDGLTKAQKAGDLSPDGVARALGEEPGSVAVRRALAIHDQQLVGRGAKSFDDIGDDAGREALPGTKWASDVNSFDEELTRGAVFLKALDDGLDPRLAAKRSRHAMLDYSDEGLTKFERDVLQRVMFFYKFPRRVLPAGLEFMVRYPGATMGLSEAGLGVAQGARNEYNEKIGPYLDSPLEAVVGNLFGLATNPLEGINPVLGEALKAAQGDGFSFTEALPPVEQAIKFGERQLAGEGEALWNPEGGISPNAPGPFGVGALFGFREGKDFGAERWREDMAERVAEKGEPSDLDRLILWAEREGIEDPYKMSKGKLARALQAKGYTAQEIGALLKGE